MSEKLDNPSPPDEKLFDPLSEVTRKDHRAAFDFAIPIFLGATAIFMIQGRMF